MNKQIKEGEHSFSIKLAMKYGVENATFLKSLIFWIDLHKANNKHFHNGYYWAYNTLESLQKLFPYWSKRQLERIINNLKKAKVIEVSHFNKTPFDRTSWYTIIDEEIIQNFKLKGSDQNGESEKTGRCNAISPNGGIRKNRSVTPIPDTITDSLTDIDDHHVNSGDFKFKIFEDIFNCHPLKSKKDEVLKIIQKDIQLEMKEKRLSFEEAVKYIKDKTTSYQKITDKWDRSDQKYRPHAKKFFQKRIYNDDNAVWINNCDGEPRR